MDKIREEFEKEYDVIEFRLDSDFPVFEAGYKSRDGEVEKLRSKIEKINYTILDIRYYLNINDPMCSDEAKIKMILGTLKESE